MAYRLSPFSNLEGSNPFWNLELSFDDSGLIFAIEEDFEEAQPADQNDDIDEQILTCWRTVGTSHPYYF